ncbi:hypothetical protein QFZ73_006034 [Peribacillus sp. V2I11]|nr:hypothetical protein [Peribacillus sp. V2I11]
MADSNFDREYQDFQERLLELDYEKYDFIHKE